MKKNLYAVIDTASGIYDGPFPLQSDAFAIRGFSDTVMNADSPMSKHPEDYALIKVGQWNDGTGELEDFQNTTLITGLEAVANARNSVSKPDLKEVESYGGTA